MWSAPKNGACKFTAAGFQGWCSQSVTGGGYVANFNGRMLHDKHGVTRQFASLDEAQRAVEAFAEKTAKQLLVELAELGHAEEGDA